MDGRSRSCSGGSSLSQKAISNQLSVMSTSVMANFCAKLLLFMVYVTPSTVRVELEAPATKLITLSLPSPVISASAVVS